MAVWLLIATFIREPYSESTEFGPMAELNECQIMFPVFHNFDVKSFELAKKNLQQNVAIRIVFWPYCSGLLARPELVSHFRCYSTHSKVSFCNGISSNSEKDYSNGTCTSLIAKLKKSKLHVLWETILKCQIVLPQLVMFPLTKFQADLSIVNKSLDFGVKTEFGRFKRNSRIIDWRTILRFKKNLNRRNQPFSKNKTD